MLSILSTSIICKHEQRDYRSAKYFLILQWNLCNPKPELSDILRHPTKIYGPKVFLLTKFRYPVHSDSFPWCLGVSDQTGSTLFINILLKIIIVNLFLNKFYYHLNSNNITKSVSFRIFYCTSANIIQSSFSVLKTPQLK